MLTQTFIIAQNAYKTIHRLKLLGIALLKEIILTPFKQRQSRFKRKRKNKSQNRSGAGNISEMSKNPSQVHSYPEE